ncbi:cubilin [Sinocyclocheilus grahami]|uniref:cubilin n=1 Tax=Sinocyclocheilus grahami TaxID=75366 RepID=UPI0007AD286F|nr:PREDICTED: cubilin [Sinocyclocheilus grahami]
MARTLSFSWLLVFLLFLSGLECDHGGKSNNRQKRDISTDQPRMISENGHLTFSAGYNKDIRFTTSGTGSVKVGAEDLIHQINQIKINKDDIDTIKNSGPSPDITNQLNQLNTRVTTLETKVQTIEQTVQRKTCSSNPCQNAGTCLNLLDAFHCLCPDNWQGPTCAVDVNECQVLAGTPVGCQNGATCVNTPGSFTCTCTAEWYGPHCTSRYDDCAGGSQDLCVHGLCIDSDRVNPNEPKYKCICDAGWMSPPGESACTADVDECGLPNKPCSTNPPVQCFNTLGSFYCGACPAGWQGNGYSCQDVDECATNNGGCSTSPMVPCLNTMGSFHCGQCPPGYEGDGKTCTQADICSANNGGCYPLATCTSTPGSIIPSCTCPPGYVGNGYGPTGCTQISDICGTSNPCVNGQCENTATGYICRCDPGWAGQNCDQNVNECSSNPCQNGGTCIDGINGYTCTCTSQWTGPQCQTPQQECGGVLESPAGTFSYPMNPGTGDYDHQVSCAWVIRTDPSKILRITFPFFDIENSASCNFDFLQVHDGESASAFMIGKYCGTAAPAELFSSHNSLYFWFRSDHSVSGRGFTVAWQSQAPVCGGELTNTYGDIKSPGYPGNYPPNRDCYWMVNVNPGLLITFAFGTLSLEHHDNCNFDYLEIRDGLLPEDPVLGKYCSTASPPPLQTTGPSAWIRFHSDFSISDRGFHITYTTSPSDPGCGGVFTDTEGIIISPNWPNNYAHNRQCIYIIRMPRSEQVALNFTHMDLETHSGCLFDFVEVRDGTGETDPLIGKYCGSTLPAPILSTTNGLWIRFKSDSSVSRAGFRAMYELACGGTLSGNGQIRTPLHPDPYPHNKVCEWVINQPEGYVVTLNFLTFDVEGSSTCVFDYVEVRDGPSIDSPLIGRYCGINMPPMLESTQRSMFIRFKTDSSVSNHGFTAEFASAEQGCGETLTEPTGSFTSPGHPTDYPHGANCTWYISVEPGNLIRLSFTTFNLEYHTNCGYDYVDVYDNGTALTGTLMGRFCGRSVPPSLTSTDSLMTILLVSDSSLSAEGFSADYVSINASTGCGETLTEPTGSFTSPGHPTDYPHGANCTWYISVEPGNLIRLSFTTFNLEYHTNCGYDYVDVYDNGTALTGTLMGRFCGRSVPPSLTSTDSLMTILLVSDSSLSAEGFSADYVSINASTDCSEVFRSPTGDFSSPNYPDNYPNNRECVYKIIVEVNMQIMLNVTDFELEGFSSCGFDYLEIRDGGYETSPLIGKYCGTNGPPIIVSHSNRLWLKFRSDHSLTYRGLKAHWDGTQTGCGGTLTTSVGGFSSPNYPLPYHANAECYWHIKTSAGSTVELSFGDFHLENSINCYYDYLAVYDGDSTSSPEVAKLCGNQIPPPISSSRDNMYVKLRTDSIIHTGGFLANYQTICQGVLIANRSRGKIESLNFPNDYPFRADCSWTIQASMGNTINYTFITFEVEHHVGCAYDFVKLYDGPNDQATLIGTFCGNTPPPASTTTGTSLHIVFRSDMSVSYRGFQMDWYQNGCGGELFGPTGAFTSPGYPDKYPASRECIWHIQTSPGSSISITILEFDVEYHPDCNYDKLEVYGGPDLSSPRLAQLCTTRPPSNPLQVASTGNTVTVRFTSDAVLSGRGFNATWVEVPGGCGGIVTAPNGEIHSPQYPSNYPDNVDCSWVITVDVGHRVFFNFTDLDLESHSSCSFDYVAIHDGHHESSPLLGKFCGVSRPSPITSTRNVIYVRFRSDHSQNRKGFSAQFSEACGSTIAADDVGGEIASPRYPYSYPPNQNCSWIIQTQEPFNHVTLSFTDFEVEMVNSNCSHDRVEVLDGDNYQAPSVGRYCGNELPHPVTSFSNALVVNFISDASVGRKGFRRELPGSLHSNGDAMFLRFTSDGSINGRGFNATFSRGCGGFLHTDRGVLSSPQYPQNYKPNMNCNWQVMVTSGFRVSVTFQSPFQIQGYGDHCSSGDYLELRNGPDGNSPTLSGRLCGSSAPSTFQTTDNSLYAHFVSDGSNEASGFKLVFEAHSSACGGLIELNDGDPPGYITSPNYPSNYPQNIDCVWIITVPNGEAVQLDFEDEFYIEAHTGCMYDYLEIRDGPTSDAVLMGRLCGNTRPSTQHSSGTTMYIRFRTDGSVTHIGFKAKYSIATCGGTYIGQSGIIRSPGYPDSNYPDNSNCEWYLEGPTGHYLTFTYTALDLQSSSNCNNDYVEIREYNASGRLLGKHCGNSVPTPLDTGDSFAYVKFVSDGSGNAAGFSLLFEASVEECGGDLNAPFGTISSPNYPNLYPHSRVCRWRITVPPGRRVTLTINDLRLEEHGTCMFDYVEVINGLTPSAPHLGRLCGTVPAGTQLKSSGNTMLVIFSTDSSVSNGGFTADYSSEEAAVCGGILSQPGNFTSPDFGNGNYSNNLNCEWLIQNPHHMNSSIVVIIDELHLEHHQTCEWDYLEFRLGDMNGELLAHLCGQSPPTIPIVVSTPELWVHFLSDEAVGDLGFKATYYFSECGGSQSGEGGAISSPGYPNNYPSPSRCTWFLEAPVGHTIILTFTYFEVEEHSQCTWDSVTIFNGASPGSPVIGQYCGHNSPGTIQSGSNKLVVVFLADHTVSRGGFTATWSTDSSGCGGIIHADTGTIKSPNYPQNFPANTECSWTIIAHDGNHLEMGFASDFQIPDSSGQCQNSYIKVWTDNVQNDENLLATACGTTAPAVVIAPRNVITARFQSSDTPGKGFSAAFYTSCGANFTASTGRVVSPNYPDHYPGGSNCNYIIDAGDQTVIVLTFKSFQLEAHSTCVYDGVKIYSGITTSGVPLATLCGNTIPGVFTTFGPMLINFYSDSIIHDNGFLAEYRTIPCGGVFNGTSGTISSPSHSITNYHHNINCTYYIYVRDNRVIDLKFNSFSLEASSTCRYDYVAVYDGENTLAPLVGKFCGRELPPNLRSSSKHLFLEFVTDSSVAAEGPQQGCGGYLSSSPTGTFGSPDIDMNGQYEPRMDCMWTIAVEANKGINLTFTSFELEGSTGTLCRYDYVKIYDGDSASYPLVGTFCGDVVPAPFVSASNFLTVHFISDGTVQRRGFIATYSTVDPLCGGAFNATGSSQTITSPYYPNAYPPFASCRWVLDAPSQEVVKVSVQQFHLDSSQSCTSNFLEFKDFPVGDYGQAHKFCGTDSHVPDFYSYGRTMHITFKSDLFMTGDGFSLTFQVAGCSRVYEQEYGYLKSPGWPDIYPHSLECSVVLQAPQNSVISLFFTSFDVENHPSCNFDYLEVRNGSTATSPLLGKYCGSTLPNPVFPGSNQLFLYFKSDFTTARNGFEITWTSSPQGCGGVLYGDHGSFASPNYPGTYANGTSCEWGIRAPSGRVVTVTFNQISIDDPGDCENNFLKLYDGPDANSPVVGPYCGTETNIAPFRASSNLVFVKFSAQSAVLPSGFRLTWSS